MNVIVWHDRLVKRASVLNTAMAEGIRICGDNVVTKDIAEYTKPEGDVAVFYGLRGKLRDLISEYKNKGLSTVLMDLGIWNRKRYNGDVRGYHKLSVNDTQPIHLIDADLPTDRFDALNITVKVPIGDSSSKPILLVGMSSKAGWVYGYEFEEWEHGMLSILREQTTKPVVYRPKPNSENKANMSLADYVSLSNNEDISTALSKSSLAVMRHSNVAFDALVNGIPFYVEEGLAKKYSVDLDNLNSLTFPSDVDRQKVLNQAAYAQWSVDEIEKGIAWKFLRDREYV